MLLLRHKMPFTRPIYLPLKRLRLGAESALHILGRASAVSRLACPALHFIAVANSAPFWLMSGWWTTLVAGVANCYCALGSLWLIPIIPLAFSSEEIFSCPLGRSFGKSHAAPCFDLLTWLSL